MLAPLDYKDLLKLLNRHKVKYLLVGGYAVIYHAEPRYTKDLDIWVEPNAKNANRIYAALKKFGAPLKDIGPLDFNNKTLVYQIGVAPVRVDIIMGISGIDFKQAWKYKNIAVFDGVKVNVMNINDLIESKNKTARKIDAVDVELLRQRLKLKRK